MNLQEIKNTIFKELPYLIQTDEEIRQFIIHLLCDHLADKFAGRDKSDIQFSLMVNALEEQRKRGDKRWEECRKIFYDNLQRLKVSTRS